MKALVVYCHPRSESFTAAVRDTVLDRLSAKGVETRLIDLYARVFDPVLTGRQQSFGQTGYRKRAALPQVVGGSSRPPFSRLVVVLKSGPEEPRFPPETNSDGRTVHR